MGIFSSLNKYIGLTIAGLTIALITLVTTHRLHVPTASAQLGSLPTFMGIEIVPVSLHDDPKEVLLANGAKGIATVEDGYATVFQVPVKQGQKVETLATELDIEQVGSYIQSSVYDQNETLLFDGGTRLQFTASYTGNYYILVRTFANKEGRVAFRAYDHNFQGTQTSVLFRNANGVISENGSNLQGPVQVLLTHYQIEGADPNFIQTFNPNTDPYAFRFINDSDGQEYVIESLLSVDEYVNETWQPLPISATLINHSQFLITPQDSYYFNNDVQYRVQLNFQRFISPNPPFDLTGAGYVANFFSSTQGNPQPTPTAGTGGLACQSDITRDGLVDIDDYSALVNHFFENTSTCSF